MILRLLGFLGGRKIKLLMGAGGLLVTLALILGGYVKGSSKASVQCAERQSVGIIKGEQNYEEVKRKVMGLSPSDLDRELAKWLRDSPAD